jgi:predicted Na+-dependent transporter
VPDDTLIALIVTFGLTLVAFAALATGLTTTQTSALAPLKGNGPVTLGVLVANFAVLPMLTALMLHAFDFTVQATMAFALLSAVAGAPFVAMFTRQGRGDAAYAASMSLILVLMTIPFMPLVYPWMLSWLDVPHESVTTWHLLEPLLCFILLPLCVGLTVKWRYPALADEVAPHCMQIAPIGVELVLRERALGA